MNKKIKNFSLLFWSVLGFVLFLGWTMNAYAANSPLAMVRQTTERAVAVLHNPTLQGQDRNQERTEQFWRIVLPGFDVQELAKRSLGAHWGTLSDQQRKEFMDLFVELVKRSYQSTLDRHTTDAQFFFDNERVEGDTAEVDTRILAPSLEKEVTVNYRLHNVNGNWLIYDVVAENISLVRNYRNQFDRLLKESSYEGLIQALKKKIQDAKA